MLVPESKEEITLSWFNDIFKPHGISVSSFRLCGDASSGRGFMGILEKVELVITRLSSVDGPQTLDIILKTLPNDPFRRMHAANDGFSSREVSLYTEVFPGWDKFLDVRQVPPASRFRHPFCYYKAESGFHSTYKYILVLENLTQAPSHFHLWKGGFTQPLQWTAASAVIRQIARFHATGIAYKTENRIHSYNTEYPKLDHIVSDIFYQVWNQGFRITKQVICEAIDAREIPDGLFEQLDKLGGEEQRDLLLKWFTQPAMLAGSKTTTICHHDLHSNNFVLSKDYESAILFDYQACCVFNPMKDLSFFLILNCHLEDSTVNLPRALDLYHDEFAKAMEAIKTNFTYSIDNIRKDYDWYLGFSIAHVISGAPVWLTGPNSTEESKTRFAMVVIDAFKRELLRFPEYALSE